MGRRYLPSKTLRKLLNGALKAAGACGRARTRPEHVSRWLGAFQPLLEGAGGLAMGAEVPSSLQSGLGAGRACMEEGRASRHSPVRAWFPRGDRVGRVGARGLRPGLPGFLLAQAGSTEPTLTPVLPLRAGCRPPLCSFLCCAFPPPADPPGWEPHLQAPALTMQNSVGSCLVSLLSRTFPLTIYLTPWPG